MASKKTVIITLIIILAVFIGALFLIQFTGNIPKNPEGTVGNTAGNLNNGGYFCEKNDTVYFSNPYDEGCLYSMTADEQKIKKLNKSPAMYLSCGGNYLYYYQKNASASSDLGFIVHNEGIYRCKTTGADVFCLDRTSCMTVNLIDNTLYYEKDVGASTLQLAAISTDKRNAQIVFDSLVNPACADDSKIYYNRTTEDHSLYSYDIRTGENMLLLDYPVWFPVLSDGVIYFLDTRNDYCVSAYDLSTQTKISLPTGRVDCFNVSDYYIYYQRNDKDHPALMRMQKDGSNPEIIAEGIYCDINITSQYVYFRAFGGDIPLYHMPVNGVSYETFDGAKQAALQK